MEQGAQSAPCLQCEISRLRSASLGMTGAGAQRHRPLVISTEVEKSLLHDKYRALGMRENLVAHAAERKLAQGA